MCSLKFTVKRGMFTILTDGTLHFEFWTNEAATMKKLSKIGNRHIEINISGELPNV